jgi:hypothetical protein
MKYRVHHLKVNQTNMQDRLQEFLNDLDGEVISVIPEMGPFLLFYGARTKGVVIVEKVK